MLDSLRNRILLTMVGVVLVTVLTLSLFAQREVEKAVFRSEEQHAKDLLGMVVRLAESEHAGLQYPLPPSIGYAVRLENYTACFDISKIKKELTEFPHLAGQIIALLQGGSDG